MPLNGHRKQTGPHCVPAPRSVQAFSNVPDGHAGEFRWSSVFFAMKGQRHSKHNVKEQGGYRAQLDKSAMLKVIAALMSDSALPQHGVRAVETEQPRTQSRLASKIGLKCRESFNRNFRKSPRMLQKRGIKAAKAFVYSFRFGQGSDAGYVQKGFRMPRAKEMARNEEFGKYWDDLTAKHSDYCWAPGWIFHPDAPGGPIDRLVLLALSSFGLFKLDQKTGRIEEGEIQISQFKIAAALGIHPETVSRSLWFWVSTGLISYQEQPGRYELAGKPVDRDTSGAMWRQPSSKIWYLPGKEFNEQQAARERARFARAIAQARLLNSPWREVLDSTHEMMLRNYVGKKHTVGQFWAACGGHLSTQGVPDQIIRALLPRPPNIDR